MIIDRNPRSLKRLTLNPYALRHFVNPFRISPTPL